ncbi:hypothetical protein CFP71_27860 [Amycolatopsis thailandensis]|uniref:Abortive infection protein-like C-terminal domain-containing protein n=1 Tax=Amycolatopsis thailandensis TaxID=589330 RepID=A0A229RU88_9PSEU|nr:hypothetical protein [Amycolatopsis thailandensis]OXM50253.1 hypothetical protein CFP71_27860 [Amycolatopsis thailandensis]
MIEDISLKVWKGLVALIRRRLSDGSLARAFPERDCPDGDSITGTDEVTFFDALDAHVQDLPVLPLSTAAAVDATVVLDIIDFMMLHIDQPTRRTSHDFFGHTHYAFDEPMVINAGNSSPNTGQEQFARDVDLLFARNGIAFTIGDNRFVTRLAPVEARSLVSEFEPHTGDPILDDKLTDALARFLSRRPAARQDALEKLWDAFERLKTLELEEGGTKKESVTRLLDDAAPSSPQLRDVIEVEFHALTGIGNRFAIRHHERDAEQLPDDDTRDYLFVRLVSLVAFVLRRTGRMAG